MTHLYKMRKLCPEKLTRGQRTGLVCLAVLLTGTCLAQESIRVNVQLVSLAATVRDARGQLVDDLTQDDFELLEDGIPQKVSYFARSADVPLTLGLVVDASDSQSHFNKQHHSDIESFLRQVLRSNDRAFLLYFGNHLRVVSDLTQSAEAIMESLSLYEHSKKHVPELGPPEIREGGTAFYDAIFYSIRERLENVDRGRRALIILSDGEDNSSAHHMLEVIETAQSTGVPLYGLRYTDFKSGRLTARNKYGMGVMDRLAKETGAEAFDARAGDLKDLFRRIGEELRSSYEIGYYSNATSQEPGFRKVTLRLKRPGLTARTKTGYFFH